MLSLAVMLALAQRCAPSVAPETLLSVARAESGFNPLTIGVNHGPPLRRQPTSVSEAIAIATRLIAAGGNIDLGIAQINSRNLGPLRLSIAEAFDPCRNLAASAELLTADYVAAVPVTASQQTALGQTFSLYNTGDPARGYANGYVARIQTAARWVLPALSLTPAPRPETVAPSPSVVFISATLEPPAWDVFAQSRAAARRGATVLVFAQQEGRP